MGYEQRLFFAFAADEEHQLYGLKGEVDDVADAEGENEGAGGGDVSECPEAEDYQMQEETAHGKAQKVLDEGSGVFVEAFDHGIVL